VLLRSVTSRPTVLGLCYTAASRQQQEQIVISPPRHRKEETIEQLKARLLYQSRKRGIKEMDLIFSNYCATHLSIMSGAQLLELDTILNQHDNEWDMYNWLVGRAPIPDYLQGSQVFKDMQDFTRNRGKELRTQMPELQPK